MLRERLLTRFVQVEWVKLAQKLLVGQRKPNKHDTTVCNCSFQLQASEDPPPMRFARPTLQYVKNAGSGHASRLQLVFELYAENKHFWMRISFADPVLTALSEIRSVDTIQPSIPTESVQSLQEQRRPRIGACSTAKIRRMAQHADGCVVYGMPKAVIEQGSVDRVLPLGKIAPAIVRHVKRSRNA